MFGFGVNQAHEFFIMNSDMLKEKVINYLNAWANDFEDPDELLDAVLNYCGNLDQSNFTDGDWNDIVATAEIVIWSSKPRIDFY